MIVWIVPIVPVVSTNFETIRTNGTIGGFHTIVSIASKTTEFLHVFHKMPNIIVGFNQRVNLVACYLLILSILRRNKLEMFHEDTASRQELDRGDYLLLRYCLFAVQTFLYFSFCFSDVPRPDHFSLITGIKVMISGIAFDSFEIYTIVPIVRIELTSIQAIKVVPVVRVINFAIGCPGSVSI